MTVFACLRVSKDDQDVANQRHGLLEYANRHGLVPITFYEEAASSRIPWRERQIGALLDTATAGDIILVSEITRFGRSVLEVLEILKRAAERQVSVHIVKNNWVLDSSLQSTILATVLGLAGEIEREFISMRTKEALARRKAEGASLGRPKGSLASERKMDRVRDEAVRYLSKGLNKSSICKLLEVSRPTFNEWLSANTAWLKQQGIEIKKTRQKR